MKLRVITCLYLLIFGLIAFTVHGQVTIGMDELPATGSVLDLKTLTEDSQGGPNANKALKLPRVALTSKTSLAPLVAENVSDYAAQKIIHKGCILYNTTSNAAQFLEEGIYWWTGENWEIAWTPGGNLLSADDAEIGTKTAVPLRFNVTDQERMRIDAQGQVGIGTVNPQATLHVTGNARITNTPLIENAEALAIDANGNIGKLTSVPLKICFAQSAGDQLINTNALKTSFNNGSPLIVSWVVTDIEQDNLTTFNATENSFELKEGGFIEVSGFVNYYAQAVAPASWNSNPNNALLNVLIQYQLQGTTTWQQFAGTRGIWSGLAAQTFGQAVVVPPTVRKFNAGDKIRMVIMRPTTGGGTPMGLEHSSGLEAGIERANGTNFSKNIKIMKLGD